VDCLCVDTYLRAFMDEVENSVGRQHVPALSYQRFPLSRHSHSLPPAPRQAGYVPLAFVASYPNVACYGAPLGDLVEVTPTAAPPSLPARIINHCINPY